MGPIKHVLDVGARWRNLENTTTVRVRRRCGLMSNYFDQLYVHGKQRGTCCWVVVEPVRCDVYRRGAPGGGERRVHV